MINKHPFSDIYEEIANGLLESYSIKPNYSNRDFMNCLQIFMSALMDKLWDNQEFDNMSMEDRENMALSCGNELRKVIHTYTGIDTHEVEKLLNS